MSARVVPITPRRRVTLDEEAWQAIAHVPETERGPYVSALVLAEARRARKRTATYRIEVLREDGTVHHSERGILARQVVARLKPTGAKPRTMSRRVVRETDGQEMVVVDGRLVERSG